VGIGIIGKEGNTAAAVSDFNFTQFKYLDRLVLHHGRWFYYRLSYFFVYFGWKNIIITFMMYFYLIQNAYSGSSAFTDMYLVLYNAFFGVAFSIYFALYEQDINDDLQP
jgi:phospholipid-translocating ATPase